MSAVNPKFCYLCSSPLEKQSYGWFQCSSDNCGEMFRTYKDADNNQIVTLFRTPFTPE